MSIAASLPLEVPTRPAWKLDWLTPWRCRLILLALILWAVVPRLFYLNSPQALDLSPDEAQYWVWSRQLDWSYYSKGPMVALIIRASTEIFGNTMAAVRYPAVLIGVLMTLMTYGLTKKLFGSERIALGAVALNYFVPMFIAGSMLMTIDPPFVLFWSAATYALCIALFDNKKWAWPLIGLCIGLSFLAKYTAFVFFLGMLVVLISNRAWWKHWKGLFVAVLIASLCTLPVIYWNWKNGWASAHHVGADTTNGFNPAQPFEFIGGQLAVIGPLLAILMVAAFILALRKPQPGVNPEHHAKARVLVLTVLPYAAIIFSMPFFTNAQLNWTAPIFFVALIVTAWFLSIKLASPATWKPWRGFLWGTVVFGLVLMPVAHNVRMLYPAFAWFLRDVQGKFVPTRANEPEKFLMTEEQKKKNMVSVRRFDPTARLLGWRELALELDKRRLASVGEDAFFMVDDYAEASEIAFYAPGHPKTYVMGPYIEDPSRRGRSSQWDIWPDRSLERGKTLLIGRNAIYIGKRWKVIDDSFERVERLYPNHDIYVNVNGVDYQIGGYGVFACYNFKGMVRPTDGKVAW